MFFFEPTHFLKKLFTVCFFQFVENSLQYLWSAALCSKCHIAQQGTLGKPSPCESEDSVLLRATVRFVQNVFFWTDSFWWKTKAVPFFSSGTKRCSTKKTQFSVFLLLRKTEENACEQPTECMWSRVSAQKEKSRVQRSVCEAGSRVQRSVFHALF